MRHYQQQNASLTRTESRYAAPGKSIEIYRAAGGRRLIRARSHNRAQWMGSIAAAYRWLAMCDCADIAVADPGDPTPTTVR